MKLYTCERQCARITESACLNRRAIANGSLEKSRKSQKRKVGTMTAEMAKQLKIDARAICGGCTGVTGKMQPL